MHDKNNSPYDWYIGSYIIRFIELKKKRNQDPNKKFLAWENTIIVKAKSFEKAYKKIKKIAKLETKPYKGGKRGVPVQWVFVGITELLPIYKKLEDGAELMWREHKPKKLKKFKKLVGKMSDFKQ